MFERRRPCFILVVLALGSCTNAEGKAGPQVVFAVRKGNLELAGSYYGEIQAANAVAVFTPAAAGFWTLTVRSVLADGTPVHEGDVVLEFDRGPIEDELHTKETELAVAQADRDRAAFELERERIETELGVRRRELLVEQAELAVVEGVNLISEVQLQRARKEVERAQLELRLARDALQNFARKRAATMRIQDVKVEAARAKVTDLTQVLERLSLRSPANGIVYAPYTRINWRRTKVVPGTVASAGDRVLEIPDLSKLEVQLYVRQRDAAAVNEGDPAVVYAAVQADRPLRGRVGRKESMARTRNERLGTETPDGNLKELLVVIRLDEPAPGLLPGNTVRAEVTTTVAQDVLVVPLIALRSIRGKYFATLENGSEREVIVGRTTITHAEITRGLAAGDRVLLPE